MVQLQVRLPRNHFIYCCESIPAKQLAVLSQHQALTLGVMKDLLRTRVSIMFFSYTSQTFIQLPNLNHSSCIQCLEKQFLFIITPTWSLQYSWGCQIAISAFTLSLYLSSCPTGSVSFCVLCSFRNDNLKMYHAFVWNNTFFKWHVQLQVKVLTCSYPTAVHRSTTLWNHNTNSCGPSVGEGSGTSSLRGVNAQQNWAPREPKGQDSAFCSAVVWAKLQVLWNVICCPWFVDFGWDLEVHTW